MTNRSNGRPGDIDVSKNSFPRTQDPTNERQSQEEIKADENTFDERDLCENEDSNWV